MIELAMAAVVVANLGDRPEALLGVDGKTGYVSKLEQKLDDPGFKANYVQNALAGCDSYRFEASDYRELGDQDVGSTEAFYAQKAQKPAIIEHVVASGCGKSFRVNVIAMRMLADGELKFFIRTPGETVTGLILQNDAYLYASQGAMGARVMAGLTTPCNEPVIVYDTKAYVGPQPKPAPWKEVWFTSLCSNKARIEMNFTPTQADGGTDIRVRVMKAQE